LWFSTALVVALAVAALTSAAEEPRAAADGKLDAAALTALIDREIERRWQADGAAAAPRADDAEFLRRVTLDIVGKIPSVTEVRAFLDDRSPEKRRRLVEELLDRGAFATHFANTWRDIILPGANTNLETRALAPPFDAWLRIRFSVDTPYDRLVTELLTPAAMNEADPNPFVRRASVPSPLAFYQVNERKPENLAANAARIFLGTQVQCAQCHDHPFTHWKRNEFWAFAAFFGGAALPADAANEAGGEKAVEAPAAVAGLSIKVPESDMVVEAKFLDGTPSAWKPGDDARLELARWITRRDNPYFARATVNRIWEHFFGRGLVDPADDLDARNPPSHPQLFAELARQFVEHGYDFKYLIRAITASRAYQLTSRTDSNASSNGDSADDPQLFARMSLRRMTPEQLYDSLVEATGFRDNTPRQQAAVFGVETARAAFQAKFADQSARRGEAQTSILQALALMNGSLVGDATSLDRSERLAGVAAMDDFLDARQRIEALFLATLNRSPELAEAELFGAHLEQAGPEGERAALADVFWALLNSAEFIMNH
jgi:hypothetical protein